MKWNWALSLAALAVVTVACAQETQEIKYSGWIDLYYGYNFNEPPVGANGSVENVGRAFDNRHNSFSLSLVHANIWKEATAPGQAGFTLTVGAGKIADIAAGGTPNSPEEDYKNLLQAYVTYVPAEGWVLDFGKFFTPIGYESTPSFANVNYSRSFLYTFTEPVYHTGLRVGTELGPVDASFYVVNGWNNVEDDNDQKTFILALQGDAGPVAFELTGVTGTESTTSSKARSGLYFDANFNASEQLSVGLTGSLGEDKAFNNTATWRGFAGYLSYKIDEKQTLSLRAETLDTDDGWLTTPASNSVNLDSITVTYGYQLAENLHARLEYRRDNANTAFFLDTNGNATKKNQQTLLFALGLKF